MVSPLFNESFNILTIDENRNPVEFISHRTDKATYIGSCICLGVAASKTPAARTFYVSYAGRYCPQSSDSWRKQMSDEQVVDLFWDKFSRKGCLFLDDKTMKNLDLMGLHMRVDWGTNGFQFDPQLQAIHLNGTKIDQMTAAGLLAEKSPHKHSKEQKRFHNYQFGLSTTIAHEITHLFGTFVGLGKIATPPREGREEAKETAKDKQPAEDKEPIQDDGPPEGGEYMEEAVFGGRVMLMKDPLDDADQAGVPYLVNKAGMHQITDEAVERFLRYDFRFPFETDIPADPEIRSLGAHHGQEAQDIIHDPLTNLRTFELLRQHESSRIRWNDVGGLLAKAPPAPKQQKITLQQYRLLQEVPLNPKLRLVGKPKDQAVAAK